MKLDQIQARLSAYLCSESGEPAVDLIGEVVAPSGLSARASLDIYRDGLRAKIAERLAGAFPKLAALLGPTTFATLAQEQFLASPDEERTLEMLVTQFPSFLRAREPLERADLADLAVLEVACREVADETAQPVSADVLAGLATADWPAATLHLVPALRTVPVRFAVGEVWDRLDAGEPPPAPSAGRSTILVWRCAADVLHSSLPDDEAEALRRVQSGATLDQVVAAFAADADPAQAAYDVLTAWLEDGLIAAVEIAPGRGTP